MEMREISTVNIERDGAESIQWNWKIGITHLLRFGVNVRNPFNGIESLHHEHPAGLVTGRIHSMELKVGLFSWKQVGVGFIALNPFNGIESNVW